MSNIPKEKLEENGNEASFDKRMDENSPELKKYEFFD